MRLRQRIVQFQGSAHRRAGFGHGFARRHKAQEPLVVPAVADTVVGQSVGRVKGNGLSEVFEAFVKTLTGHLVNFKPSFEEQVVGVQVFGITFDQRRRDGGQFGRRRRRGKPGFEGFHNGPRDLVLNLEDVRHFPVVPFRPQIVPLCRANQLDTDPNPVTRPANTSLQHAGYPESLADPANILLRSPEDESRRAGSNPEVGYVSQSIDDFLGQAVAEILILLIGTEIQKRQDRNGGRGMGRRSGLLPQTGSIGVYSGAGPQAKILPLEGIFHVRDRLPALVGVLAQTAHHDRFDVGRNVSDARLKERLRLVAQYRGQSLQTGLAMKRAPPGEHFIEQGAE